MSSPQSNEKSTESTRVQVSYSSAVKTSLDQTLNFAFP